MFLQVLLLGWADGKVAGALVVNRVTFAIKNHCDKFSENHRSSKVKRPNNSRQAATQIFQVLIIRALNVI